MNTPSFILDLVLKSTALLLLALALQQFQARSSAAHRGFLWLITFMVLALLPVGLLGTPKVVLNWLPHHEQSTPAVSLPPIKSNALMPLPLAATQVLPKESVRRSFTSGEIIFAIWMLGALLVIAQRMIGEVRLRTLRRRSQLVSEQNITQRVSQLAHELEIGRSIEVLQSDAMPVPVTWGTLRPALMLPSDANAWNDAQLDAALRHELGHIRHFDSAKRLLAQAVCAAHWFNPLVWLAARSWSTAQEQACDDFVLRSGADAENYAMQLLHASQSLGSNHAVPDAALAMAKPSTLETRLTAIVDDSRNRHPVSRTMKIAGATLGLITLALGATLQLRGEDKPVNTAKGDRQISIRSRVIEAPAGTMRTILHEIAPGLAGASMITSEAQTETIIKRLNTLQGVDLLTTPQVTTRSGQRGTVEIGRDVVFDPGDPKKTEFIGVRIDLLPTFDGKKFDLEIEASVSEQTGAIGERPVIQAHKVQSQVSVQAGSTVLLLQDGGMKNGAQREIIFLVSPKLAVNDDHAEAVPPPAPKPPKPVTVIEPDSKSTDPKAGIVPAGSDAKIKITAGTPNGKDATPQAPDAKAAAIAKTAAEKRAETIIIPEINFNDATLDDTVEFLRTKSRKLDPQKQGVNIILIHGGDSKNATLTLSLRDVPLSEALRYVATLSGLEIEADDNAIMLKPAAKSKPDSKNTDPKAGIAPAGHDAKKITAGTPNGKDATPQAPDAKAAAIQKTAAEKRAETIIIPEINFNDATLDDTVEFLRIKSRKLDPQKQGMNIILIHSGNSKNAKLTLKMRDVPLSEVLRNVAAMSGLEIEADDNAIVLKPAAEKVK